MKRFLRYFVYRELYRALREMTEGGDDKEPNRRRPTPEAEPAARFDGDLSDAELAEIKSLLQKMDAYDFEYFVADIWARMGWETTVSSEAADRGIDVVAVRHVPYETKVLIQAKRYGPNTTVGSPDIQQYASLRQQRNGVDKVIVVTTNEFTGQARELAQQLNVKLVNGDELAAMVESLDAYDLVRDYLNLPESEPEPEPKPETGASEDATADEEDGFADAVSEDEVSIPNISDAAPRSIWHGGIWAGIVGWFLLFAYVDTMSDTAFALLFTFSWLVLPVSIYLDATYLRERTGKPRRPWLYAVASGVWFFSVVAAGYYLWRRHAVLADGAKEADVSDQTARQKRGVDEE